MQNGWADAVVDPDSTDSEAHFLGEQISTPTMSQLLI